MPIKLSNEISLWARRLALYFSLYVLIIVSHLFFKRFDWWHTDVDSARYMLSALVQSEAAIVALVVTLSLVAVQLAAQSYSARVIEVFRRTPDLWILMGIYGVAIFYGLGVLKMIENPLVGRLSNLEVQVSFAYYLGVFAFVALVPYILNILEMLKPSTVINILAEGITSQSILSAIKEEEKAIKGEPKVDRTEIQPIIDIVCGAVMKYDYETVRDGLRAIGKKVAIIFENETFEKDEEVKISRHIFDNLIRVGKLATIKENEDSTVEVIDNLHKIGITVAKRKLEFTTHWIIISLKVVGIVAAERNLEWPTTDAVYSLGEVGKAAAEHKLNNEAQQAESSLRIFLEIKVLEHNENIKWYIKEAIGKITIALNKTEMK